MLQTVERALTVLEHVARSRSAPTLREVATALNLNITTVYHLFNTLEHRGYLVRDDRGGLRIGASAAVLHQALVAGMVTSRDLRPVIETLSAATDETAYLTSWTDRSVVIQAVVEAPQALRVSGLYVGYRGNEITRASGRAVLAHLPAEARSEIVRRNLDALDPERRELVASRVESELAAVSRSGIAVDNEDYAQGVCCVAAPYFGPDGSVSGSVAVSAPAMRFPKQRKTMAAAVLEAARTCSSLMGSTDAHPTAR